MYYSLKDLEITELVVQANSQRIVWKLIIEGSVTNFAELHRALRKIN
jgi:hypothetical protein